MTQEPTSIKTLQESEVRIEDYLWIILRSKWSIMIIFLVAVITALIKNDMSPPIYEANVTIWVKQQENRPLEDFLSLGLERVAQLETLRELIKSQRVAQLTEAKLDLSNALLPKHRGKLVDWMADVLGIELSKTKAVRVIGVQPYSVATEAEDVADKAKDFVSPIKADFPPGDAEEDYNVENTRGEERGKGFCNEDVILKFDDISIENINSLRNAIAAAGVGEHSVTILRGWMKRMLVLNLQEDDLDRITKGTAHKSEKDTFEELPIGLTVQNTSFEEQPKENLPLEQRRRKTIEALLDNLSVEPIRETAIIKVTVKSGSRERARIIADTIAEIFHNQMRDTLQSSMENTVAYANTGLKEVEVQLEAAQEKLKEFETEHNTVHLTEEAKVIVNKIADLDIQIYQAESSKKETEAKLDLLMAELSNTSETVISAETLSRNPILATLRESLIQTETHLDMLKAQYKDDERPEIKWQEGQKKWLKEKITTQTENILSSKTTALNPIHLQLRQNIISANSDIIGYEAMAAVLAQRRKAYDAKIQSWPEKKLVLSRLEQEVAVYQKVKDSLLEAQQGAMIASHAEPESVIVWDKAIDSEFPISPRKKMNLLLGALIGLTLGIGLAFLREYMDNTYPTLYDAVRDLESLPMPVTFLGMIPGIEEEEEGEGVILKTDAARKRSKASEAFRIMRTKLQFIDTDSPPKTILVTSSKPEEGKTTIASNLAIFLAQMNKRVLILDADMRRPSLHKIFPKPELNGDVLDDNDKTAVSPPQNEEEQAENSSANIEQVNPVMNLPDKSEIIASSDGKRPGLSELLMLMNENDPEDALSEIVRETEVPNLYFIPSGTNPPNPSELLNSDNMEKLTTLLEEKYDYVVIDSPPVKAVADPAILASTVDCVIFVFDIAKTRKYEIRSGLEELKEASPKRIGIACNLTGQTRGYYGYGRYGYSKYGYSGRYGYISYYYDYYEVDEEDEKGKPKRKKKG